MLKWDKAHEDKGEHAKFQQLWLGPFVIKENLGPNNFHLETMDGQAKSHLVNGHILKQYFF